MPLGNQAWGAYQQWRYQLQSYWGECTPIVCQDSTCERNWVKYTHDTFVQIEIDPFKSVSMRWKISFMEILTCRLCPSLLSPPFTDTSLVASVGVDDNVSGDDEGVVSMATSRSIIPELGYLLSEPVQLYRRYTCNVPLL